MHTGERILEICYPKLGATANVIQRGNVLNGVISDPRTPKKDSLFVGILTKEGYIYCFSFNSKNKNLSSFHLLIPIKTSREEGSYMVAIAPLKGDRFNSAECDITEVQIVNVTNTIGIIGEYKLRNRFFREEGNIYRSLSQMPVLLKKVVATLELQDLTKPRPITGMPEVLEDILCPSPVFDDEHTKKR